MYVYRKKDKEKKNPIFYGDAVRYKSLFKKTDKIILEIINYFLRNNLMFDFEEEETKQEIYKAIDCLKSFQDNLKLKDSFIQD